MRKLAISLVVLATVFTALAADGILWKVTGNGITKPSYVLGSHHLAPAAFIDSIAGLREAISGVDAVYGEVDKMSLTSAETQQIAMRYSMAPADSTLSKVFTAAELNMIDSVMAVYTGQSGMIKMMDMLKPAILTAQIEALRLTQAFPEMQVTQPFDVAVMALGEEQGKAICGFETLDEQMTMLFGTPIKKQAEALIEAIVDSEKSMAQTRELTESYLRQDLDAVTRICTDPEYGIETADQDRLIYNRNRAWADKLADILPGQSTFVVVGCGHLGGEQGLLNLLRNKGFVVESMNK